MALPYNPNTISYGSRVIDITRSSTSLITNGSVAENINIDRPTVSIDRKNEIGKPTGFILVEAPVTGTLTWQYTENKTPIPSDKFTETFDSVIGAETFVVTQVGTPLAQLDYFKTNISFRKDEAP